MLKYNSYWFIVLGIVANCSGLGQIKVSHDSFRNAHIVTMKLANNSQEKVAYPAPALDFMLPNYRGTFDLFREIKEGKPNPSEIQLSIVAFNENPLLTAKGGIRIGTKMFDIVISDISGETVTSHKTQAKENSFTGKTEVSTSSSSHKVLRGKISLTKEIEDQILKANDLTLRVYSGNYAITFIFAGDDFLKLKDYLTTKPAPGQI